MSLFARGRRYQETEGQAGSARPLKAGDHQRKSRETRERPGGRGVSDRVGQEDVNSYESAEDHLINNIILAQYNLKQGIKKYGQSGTDAACAEMDLLNGHFPPLQCQRRTGEFDGFLISENSIKLSSKSNITSRRFKTSCLKGRNVSTSPRSIFLCSIIASN